MRGSRLLSENTAKSYTVAVVVEVVMYYPSDLA